MEDDELIDYDEVANSQNNKQNQNVQQEEQQEFEIDLNQFQSQDKPDQSKYQPQNNVSTAQPQQQQQNNSQGANSSSHQNKIQIPNNNQIFQSDFQREFRDDTQNEINSEKQNNNFNNSHHFLKNDHNIRYFIIRNNDRVFLECLINKNICILQSQKDKQNKLQKSIQKSDNQVILVFSNIGTQQFLGYAKMLGDPDNIKFISDELESIPDQSGYDQYVKIEWVQKQPLNYDYFKNILNPWNQNKIVNFSNVVQDIEPEAALKVLEILNNPPIETETLSIENQIKNNNDRNQMQRKPIEQNKFQVPTPPNLLTMNPFMPFAQNFNPMTMNPMNPMMNPALFQQYFQYQQQLQQQQINQQSLNQNQNKQKSRSNSSSAHKRSASKSSESDKSNQINKKKQKKQKKQKSYIEKLSAEQIEEFKEAFGLFDSNKDDTIKIKDLNSILKALGHELSEKELQDIIKQADPDDGGILKFQDFLQIIAKLLFKQIGDSDSEEKSEQPPLRKKNSSNRNRTSSSISSGQYKFRRRKQFYGSYNPQNYRGKFNNRNTRNLSKSNSATRQRQKSKSPSNDNQHRLRQTRRTQKFTKSRSNQNRGGQFAWKAQKVGLRDISSMSRSNSSSRDLKNKRREKNYSRSPHKKQSQFNNSRKRSESRSRNSIKASTGGYRPSYKRDEFRSNSNNNNNNSKKRKNSPFLRTKPIFTSKRSSSPSPINFRKDDLKRKNEKSKDYKMPSKQSNYNSKFKSHSRSRSKSFQRNRNKSHSRSPYEKPGLKSQKYTKKEQSVEYKRSQKRNKSTSRSRSKNHKKDKNRNNSQEKKLKKSSQQQTLKSDKQRQKSRSRTSSLSEREKQKENQKRDKENKTSKNNKKNQSRSKSPFELIRKQSSKTAAATKIQEKFSGIKDSNNKNNSNQQQNDQQSIQKEQKRDFSEESSFYDDQVLDLRSSSPISYPEIQAKQIQVQNKPNTVQILKTLKKSQSNQQEKKIFHLRQGGIQVELVKVNDNVQQRQLSIQKKESKPPIIDRIIKKHN